MPVNRCLFCRSDLGSNSTVERFPGARRVAYDPFRGRLWAVCRGCSRWTLAPIETRWEALEELERLTKDRARLLAQTENVGLLVAGDVEIVRVGRAALREEAWWRYGKELRRRTLESRRIAKRGKVKEALVSLAVIGIPLWGFHSSEDWIDAARDKRFGRLAWRGRTLCDRCGEGVHELRFDDGVALAASSARPDHIALRVLCNRHGVRREPGGYTLTGPAAQHVLRRVLAHHNFAGASNETLADAVHVIEQFPTAVDFCSNIAAHREVLRSLPVERRLALEIAVNDTHERDLLALELRELERRWREEEEIAAIVDRELT
jgi:hypothetical protein